MDARIVRTRRRLQEALLALARERGLEQISVSDIAERADVNRSTFYQHYSDKETLLADALDQAAADAGARFDAIVGLPDEPPEGLRDFLAHIDENADLYVRVFTEPGFGMVLARLRRKIEWAVADIAARSPSAPFAVPVDVIGAGVAGAVIGVIAAWLSREPRADVDEAAMWVWRVVIGPGPDARA